MADAAVQPGFLSAGDGLALGAREQLAEGEEKDGAPSPPLIDDKRGTGCRAMAKRIVVIEERAFYRECVVRMLREILPEHSVVGLECVHGASADESAKTVDVVILDIGLMRLPDDRVASDVRFLQERFQGVPIVLLSDREDSAHVAEALSYGVRGFIPTSLGAGVVAEAVRLIGAGGTFVPASALIHALAAHQEGARRGRAGDGNAVGLTPRECEVLNLLREGKPNKIIAFTLDLKETTVKIHVRHIMKKLKASNRTEAALMAERAL